MRKKSRRKSNKVVRKSGTVVWLQHQPYIWGISRWNPYSRNDLEPPIGKRNLNKYNLTQVLEMEI